MFLEPRRDVGEQCKTVGVRFRKSVFAEALNLPTNTTRRILEDITAQKLAVRTQVKKDQPIDGGQLSDVPEKRKRTTTDMWAVNADWAGAMAALKLTG